MTGKYRCPHCQAVLNPGTKIVLRISRGKKAGLALFSPRVGNYSVILPPDFPIQEGQRANFHCPVCSEDLTSPANSKFGELGRDRAEGGQDRIAFHRTFGKQATFVVTEDGVRAFGQDADNYRPGNFFGAGQEED